MHTHNNNDGETSLLRVSSPYGSFVLLKPNQSPPFLTNDAIRKQFLKANNKRNKKKNALFFFWKNYQPNKQEIYQTSLRIFQTLFLKLLWSFSELILKSTIKSSEKFRVHHLGCLKFVTSSQ